MPKPELQSGAPHRLGATPDADGVNFAVFSENAKRMDLCLFSDDGATEVARLPLPERTGPVWHGHAPGLKPGALYGYRAHGPYAPEQGHRFNPHKLLMDPYARRLHGGWRLHPTLLGYDEAAGDLSFSATDSAPYTPRSVVAAPQPDDIAPGPDHSWSDTVIYEAHAKGLTRRFPDVPRALAGTYEGLSSPPVVEHLHKLGVTAVELLPVQQFLDETHLVKKGLRNYWGYNTIGFFALEPRYAGPNGEQGFRRMVSRLHEAGIEVILDVVYNHTAEGDQRGPTLSFRGLDNASYYRLQAGRPRYYVNDSGCGNSLDLAHPFVMRMALDSLRYWVTEMGVDGFRFDLATALGREERGFTPDSGFLDALRQDPALNRVKLIAEPWDVGPGGYQLGGFPPEFSEWNDGYRDSARRFWRGHAHGAQDLAGRLLGSAATFDRPGAGPRRSVNMIAAHDGFTLADLTAYDRRHNEANGENNADGHHANFSDNCGVEGRSDDPEILARRQRRRMNLLATLFLSQGAPMLLAGDEIGHSQGGNNNAYCQDNETTWIDWAKGDAALLAFTRRLIAFRKAHGVLRQSRYLHGRVRPDGAPDVEWLDFAGGPVNWRDPGLDGFCLALRGSAEAPGFAATGDAVLIAVNGADDAAALTLPPAPAGRRWVRALDTAAPEAPETDAAVAEPVAPRCIVAFHAEAAS